MSLPTFVNTRTTYGDEGALNKVIAHELTEFNDDSLSTLGQYAFYKQAQMESIYLPNLTSIAANAFNGCAGLKRVIVGTNKNSVCTLANKSAFTDTGRAVIFVPDSLVSNYKAANIWNDATIKDRIFSVNDYGLVEWDETEITDTPEQIAAEITAGTAKTKYHVGQYKSINLGTEGTVRFQIVAKEADELADNSGNMAQLTWYCMEMPTTKKRMNPAYSAGTQGTGTLGGWEYCEMRTYLSTTIWALFPASWQGMIKEVKKYTKIFDTSGSAVNNVVTSDKLWLASYREMFGGTSDETQGPIYSFAFPDNTSRIRKIVGQSSASYYWLRSAGSTSGFRNVPSGGYAGLNGANAASGVGFGFST